MSDVPAMLKDVEMAEAYGYQINTAMAAELCGHVKALAGELKAARRALLRAAARGGDWSYPDLLANVADALGLTVAQLKQQLR